ncbi:glycerophosphodiester phosphodiesterase family protein [Myxosarcina sp. GI1]|uniref:glycerophosphodiester phosphodiesterase family protein n=1 Tax=Myxosarcina sp. GI1 TaxID=1541065 RepID=UPI00068FAD48|nr:glycerophosphodiester phosphodiesterase family protein [Myxosarcina sp. GI1]
MNTLNRQKPIIIAHRGASGLRPEHTLASFRLALEQGANFIETDVVMTKDGIPIIRHEPLLDNTTNICDHPEYSNCYTTKIIDGKKVTGFFAEDFTLEDIKTLRARQPVVERSKEFDNLWEIPTLAEVIELVKDFQANTGKAVGIVHELKHNSYFNSIGLNVEEAVVKVLVESNFTKREQNIIQAFEITPLIRLKNEIMPDAGIDLALHQLVGATIQNNYPNFSLPYDLIVNLGDSNLTEADLRSIYGDLIELIDRPWRYAERNRNTTNNYNYSNLLSSPEFYQFVSTYAEAINPDKNIVLLRRDLNRSVNSNNKITFKLTGEVFPLIDLAHRASLKVNIYTLRNEEPYLSLNLDGMLQTPEAEAEKLIRLGVDGLIGDFPQTLVNVRDRIFQNDK